MHRARLGGISVTVALAATMVFATTAPAAPNDGTLGGPPLSTQDSTSCPASYFATGVGGTMGDVAGNPIAGTVTMQCEGGQNPTGSMGTGTGGAASSSSCGAGELAVGIEGREGDFIDKIAVRCQSMDLLGAVSTAAGFGGEGGGPDGPYDCPRGQALTGFTGTVTDDNVYVRNVVIACASIPLGGDGRLGGFPTTNAESTTCPEGAFATGVSGTLGSIGPNPIVGTAQMTCVGGVDAANTLGTGTGGTAASTSCSAGQIAVGIEGKEGDFIDNLAVRCQAADLSGAITTAAEYGGVGGGPDGPYDCEAGSALVGLDGTVTDDGVYVKSVGIDCAPLPPADTTTTVSVAKGKRLKVSGAVEDGEPGIAMSVTLFVKKKGKFKERDNRNPKLNGDSEYRTSFGRPNSGRCKVTAEYPGSDSTNPSSKSKKFRC
jgi:hypothetical protein